MFGYILSCEADFCQVLCLSLVWFYLLRFHTPDVKTPQTKMQWNLEWVTETQVHWGRKEGVSVGPGDDPAVQVAAAMQLGRWVTLVRAPQWPALLCLLVTQTWLDTVCFYPYVLLCFAWWGQVGRMVSSTEAEKEDSVHWAGSCPATQWTVVAEEWEAVLAAE